MRLSYLLTVALLTVSVVGAADVALAQGGKRFAHTDANGDGKISLQEFLAARGRIFERIDANHDGVITTDEIAAAGQAAEAAQAGRMIRTGKDGGGKEAGREGGHQLAHLQKMAERGPVTRQIWDELMTRRFQKLDVDHTGFLIMDQMKPQREPADAAPPSPMAPSPMAPAAPQG